VLAITGFIIIIAKIIDSITIVKAAILLMLMSLHPQPTLFFIIKWGLSNLHNQKL